MAMSLAEKLVAVGMHPELAKVLADSGVLADTALNLADGQTVTGAKTMSGANVITHAPTGLKIQDSDASHKVTIAPGNESADRTLNIPVLGGTDTLMTLALAQVIAGIKSFSAMFKIPINTPVAGAGSVIGDAAPLLTGFTVITGANGTLGWLLPVTTGGDVVIIKGTTAGVAKIWPQTGGQINAVGTSTAMSLASGLIPAIFISISATQWYTIPLLPS